MWVLLVNLLLFILAPQETYQCTPCGQDCDKPTYTKPGTCTLCNMPLVKKSDIMFRTIQPSEICGYIQKHPGVVLLDVRTTGEFDGETDNYGTLKNAINIPIQELPGRIAELADFKDKEIIVYCSHSRRSPRASYFLTQNGFKNVVNMEGGMSVMSDNSCKK